jgi:hypothetical protein
MPGRLVVKQYRLLSDDHSFWQSATSYGWLYAGEPFKAVVRLQVAF